MAKKKLLSEAQVRRFMGLAGMKPAMVSNVISEMGMGSYKRDEEEEMKEGYYEADEDPADAEMAPEEPAPEPDLEAPADMGEPADAEGGEADLDPSQIQAAVDGLAQMQSLLEPLASAAGIEMEAAPEGEDMGAVEPEAEELPPEPAPEEEEGGEEAEDEELAEVSLQLSEEEIVQEVARRVAKRIIKAKRAQKSLNEALGRK